jgi:hypothetical protein
MKRAWALIGLVLVVAGLAGCAPKTKEEPDVSTIPWNRPQGWEGQGALGGFRPPGSQY